MLSINRLELIYFHFYLLLNEVLYLYSSRNFILDCETNGKTNYFSNIKVNVGNYCFIIIRIVRLLSIK